MRRPAFPFYPYDYRNNANLRRCSWEARGALTEVMCIMHDSTEYGVLRWPLKEISIAIGAPLRLLKELAAKSVLKGGDAFADNFTHIPMHARRKGDPVVLVPGNGGPCWFSSRMVVDEWRRSVQGAGTRFTSRDESPSHAPSHGEGERPGDGPTVAVAFASSSLTTEASTISLEGLTAEARACVLMEREGCKQSNPAHPDLIAGIAEGVSPEAFATTVREAIKRARKDPFAWAVTTARARHAEGPKPAKRSARAATPSPQREPARPMTARSEMPDEAKDLARKLGIGRAQQP